MNLYLISQATNDDYDTYDSAVVAAESPKEAQKIHPRHGLDERNASFAMDCWTAPENVTVKYLGIAEIGTQKGVICASFNAG